MYPVFQRIFSRRTAKADRSADVSVIRRGALLWLPLGLFVLPALVGESPLTMFAGSESVMAQETEQSAGDPGQRAAIEIIRLRNRQASTLREAVEPFLDPRGDISLIDNNLIISTSAANLRELRELVRELDVPRRQLRITVDFNYWPGSGPGSVSTRDLVQDSQRQEIQVLEGETAFLSASESQEATVLHADSVGMWLSRQEVEADGRSLLVKAEVYDESAELSLEILSSREDDSGNGRFERMSATTMSVPVGQWALIGGSTASDDPRPEAATNQVDARISTTDLPDDSEGPRLAVRVELLE